MPMRRELYPEGWKAIATAVKEAAGWVCQGCGMQCRRAGEKLDTHRRTLTVAHLNHDPGDCRTENLKALCAPCHLRYDAKMHGERAKATRLRRLMENAGSDC